MGRETMLKGIQVTRLNSSEEYYVKIPKRLNGKKIKGDEELDIKDEDYVLLFNATEPSMCFGAQIKYHNEGVARFPIKLGRILVSEDQFQNDDDMIFIFKVDKKLGEEKIWTKQLQKMENINEYINTESAPTKYFSELKMIENLKYLNKMSRFEEVDNNCKWLLVNGSYFGDVLLEWANGMIGLEKYEYSAKLIELAMKSYENDYKEKNADIIEVCKEMEKVLMSKNNNINLETNSKWNKILMKILGNDDKKIDLSEEIKEEFSAFSADKNIKYKIPDSLNTDILRHAVQAKRIGDYELAKKIYKEFYESNGGFGELYNAWAKTLATDGCYDEAVYLFNLANESALRDYEREDHNSVRNRDTLKMRNELPEMEFYFFMRNLSGNQYYQTKDGVEKIEKKELEKIPLGVTKIVNGVFM